MHIFKMALTCAVVIILLPNKSLGAELVQQTRPILSEFIQIVIERHPELAEARALLDAARARARGSARPLYNPEVEVEYENSEINTSTVGLSQSFDWSGKREARADVAQSKVRVVEASLAHIKNNLIAELLTGLSEYQTRLDVHRLNENRVLLGEEFLSVSLARNSAGDLSQSELLTARLALAEARINIGSSRAALSEAHGKLVSLLGESRRVWPRLTGVPLSEETPVPLEDLSAFPEIIMARANTASFRSRIQRAQTERMPDPTFGVRYGEEGTNSLVGLRMSVPIPIRNNYRAEVDAARAEYIAAEQEESGVFRRVRAHQNMAHESYVAAIETWEIWNSDGSESLEEQRELLQTLWQAGEIGAVNYLVQLNQTYSAQEASIVLNGQLWRSWINWLDASATVNKWMETIR